MRRHNNCRLNRLYAMSLCQHNNLIILDQSTETGHETLEEAADKSRFFKVRCENTCTETKGNGMKSHSLRLHSTSPRIGFTPGDHYETGIVAMSEKA